MSLRIGIATLVLLSAPLLAGCFGDDRIEVTVLNRTDEGVSFVFGSTGPPPACAGNLGAGADAKCKVEVQDDDRLRLVVAQRGAANATWDGTQGERVQTFLVTKGDLRHVFIAITPTALVSESDGVRAE